jgi:fatty-acyl-CoA synthase
VNFPTRSYCHGGGREPLIGRTVGAVLDEAAKEWPDEEALCVPHQGVRLSWRELRHDAMSLAAGLLSLGMQPGDRIGMLAPNVSEWVTAQFATAYAGLILVNINPAYRPRELEYALNKVDCRSLITAAGFKTSDYVGMLRELAPAISMRNLVLLGDQEDEGFLNYAQVLARASAEDRTRVAAIAAQLDFDEPINIQFTSGTTGAPKAATLTHHNIVNNAAIAASLLQFTRRDRLCIPVPMYHCFGMVLGTLLCATSGATIVFPSPHTISRACVRASWRGRHARSN